MDPKSFLFLFSTAFTGFLIVDIEDAVIDKLCYSMTVLLMKVLD